MSKSEQVLWVGCGFLMGFVLTVIFTATHISMQEQKKAFQNMRTRNVELSERINSLNGWNENLSQITVRYMDLIDEFNCDRITFVEEKECMQQYKPR